MDRLLTADEVADYLRVDRNTIYIWCREGVLPAIKVGKEWRIGQSDLETFLVQRRREQTASVPLREMVNTRLGKNEHLLVLLPDRQAVWSLEVEFFKLALERKLPLLKGCWWQHPDDVRQRYSEAGLPVTALEATGQLVIHNFSAAYRNGGAGAVVDLWQARGREGYFWGSGSYLTGDWEEQLPRLVQFEGWLQDALSRTGGIAICPCVPNLDTPEGLSALFELTAHHTGTLMQLDDNQVSLLRPSIN